MIAIACIRFSAPKTSLLQDKLSNIERYRPLKRTSTHHHDLYATFALKFEIISYTPYEDVTIIWFQTVFWLIYEKNLFWTYSVIKNAILWNQNCDVHSLIFSLYFDVVLLRKHKLKVYVYTDQTDEGNLE